MLLRSVGLEFEHGTAGTWSLPQWEDLRAGLGPLMTCSLGWWFRLGGAKHLGADGWGSLGISLHVSVVSPHGLPSIATSR